MTYKRDCNIKHKHNDNQEHEGFKGVVHGAFNNAALALGIAMGVKLHHGFFVLLICLEHAGKVDYKPRYNGEHKLCSDKGENFFRALRVRKQHRNCFVAGGNEHGYKSAGGYHSV